jgi:hypothetical protein
VFTVNREKGEFDFIRQVSRLGPIFGQERRKRSGLRPGSP